MSFAKDVFFLLFLLNRDRIFILYVICLFWEADMINDNRIVMLLIEVLTFNGGLGGALFVHQVLLCLICERRGSET